MTEKCGLHSTESGGGDHFALLIYFLPACGKWVVRLVLTVQISYKTLVAKGLYDTKK